MQVKVGYKTLLQQEIKYMERRKTEGVSNLIDISDT